MESTFPSVAAERMPRPIARLNWMLGMPGAMSSVAPPAVALLRPTARAKSCGAAAIMSRNAAASMQSAAAASAVAFMRWPGGPGRSMQAWFFILSLKTTDPSPGAAPPGEGVIRSVSASRVFSAPPLDRVREYDVACPARVQGIERVAGEEGHARPAVLLHHPGLVFGEHFGGLHPIVPPGAVAALDDDFAAALHLLEEGEVAVEASADDAVAVFAGERRAEDVARAEGADVGAGEDVQAEILFREREARHRPGIVPRPGPHFALAGERALPGAGEQRLRAPGFRVHRQSPSERPHARDHREHGEDEHELPPQACTLGLRRDRRRRRDLRQRALDPKGNLVGKAASIHGGNGSWRNRKQKTFPSHGF